MQEQDSQSFYKTMYKVSNGVAPPTNYRKSYKKKRIKVT